MLRTAAPALAVALAVAVPLASPAPDAHARSTAVVDQTDPTGDVNVFDGGGTKPTTAQRRTIDLERFTVTRTSDGVRLTYRIARITGTRNFDQVVEMQLQKTGPGGFTLDVLANPQHRTGTAISNHTYCAVDVRTSGRTATVRVDVARECLPVGAGVMRVTTYTQEKHGSGPGYSEDTMRVRGLVSLA